VKILENSDIDYEVIDYMKSPPTPQHLQSLSQKMGLPARDFIRKKEVIFKDLELKSYLDNDIKLFKYMSENPRLIERPIVVKGDKAVLGRPPEKVKDFINS
tara:strand:+ start:71 stop:373 length:303 start_codon:yes stop_codon:yes gene_type:complete